MGPVGKTRRIFSNRGGGVDKPFKGVKGVNGDGRKGERCCKSMLLSRKRLNAAASYGGKMAAGERWKVFV